jgi:hypothetical protein
MQDEAMAQLRQRSRWMPLWITLTAWSTLFGAAWVHP